MFRHKENSPAAEVKPVSPMSNGTVNSVAPTAAAPTVKKENKDISPAALRELMEKNLKWSQIIYEQNRKINRKLLWTALAGWLRLLILIALVAVPIVLGFMYLPALVRDTRAKIDSLSGKITSTTNQLPPGAVDQILKILPVDSAARAQLKTILK